MEITLNIEQLKHMTIGEIIQMYEDAEAVENEDIFNQKLNGKWFDLNNTLVIKDGIALRKIYAGELLKGEI